MMIRMVGGWMLLLVPAHPGSPGQRDVKWLLLLLLYLRSVVLCFCHTVCNSKIALKNKRNLSCTNGAQKTLWWVIVTRNDRSSACARRRMSFVDFCKHFKSMSVCHQVNTSIFGFQKRWYDDEFSGGWVKPHHAGGCSNNRDTFFNNPQVMLFINCR